MYDRGHIAFVVIDSLFFLYISNTMTLIGFNT